MKTGVIGIGAMGKGIAMNLHKSGALHAIWNRTQSKAETIAKETGALQTNSPAHLAEECELIITCVSRDNDLLQVIEKISEGIKPGHIVVDTSTVSTNTAEKASEILQKKQAHFLDCPVSGGEEGAKNGSLVIMAGGNENILDKIRDTLSAIARDIIYMGATGSGQACKAVNQVMGAGIVQAVTEALAFGQSLGLDMDKVVDVISQGASSNWLLNNRGKAMLADSYNFGFKVSLHHKDLKICLDMCEDNEQVSLPLTEMTVQHYEKLMEQDHGDEDISSVFRLKRNK